MAHGRRIVAGYEVNVLTSKDGQTIRAATVLLGGTAPGYRVKDEGSRPLRQAAKAAVARALNCPREKVRVAAWYSCLRTRPDGLIERLDNDGRVLGLHELAD
jgi:hypothetical protein